MSISLRVNGTEYVNFTSAQVTLSYDKLSNVFGIQTIGTPVVQLDGLVELYVDTQKILTGYVEQITVSSSDDAHVFMLNGRDRTRDLVDSTLTSLSDIRSDIHLRDLIKLVIDDIGSDLQVIDNANPDVLSSAVDIESPEPGMNAFEFLETVARRRQVILSSNADGDVVIEVSDGVDNGLVVPEHIRASVVSSTTQRYRTYNIVSDVNSRGGNPLAALGLDSTDATVSQSTTVTDEAIRAGKTLTIVAEDSYPKDALRKRIAWERTNRVARSVEIEYTIAGNQIAYTPGQLVTVKNSLLGIDDTFFINETTFGYSDRDGSTTTLRLLGKRAFERIAEPKDQENNDFLSFIKGAAQ